MPPVAVIRIARVLPLSDYLVDFDLRKIGRTSHSVLLRNAGIPRGSGAWARRTAITQANRPAGLSGYSGINRGKASRLPPVRIGQDYIDVISRRQLMSVIRSDPIFKDKAIGTAYVLVFWAQN
jgi:hypothetical protein